MTPNTDDDMIERASKAYAEATDYYVEFHRGLSSVSADKIRVGVRAAIEATGVVELREALEQLTQAMRLVMPISTHDTPDYAEIAFGNHPTQAMTMIPDTWNGIASAYDKALTQLAKGSE